MDVTREDVEILKESWREYRFWDLENTTGFEEYRDELKAYRLDVGNERLKYILLSEAKVSETNVKYRIIIQFDNGGVMSQFNQGDGPQVVAERLRQFAKQIEQSVTERSLT